MVLLWSANFIVGKVALREFPPLLLGALRIGLAGIFLAPVYWRKARADGRIWPPARSDAARVSGGLQRGKPDSCSCLD